MGKNNQARRAAKAKQRARQRARHEQTARRRGPDSWSDAGQPSAGSVFDEAQDAELMWAAAGHPGPGQQVADPATALTRLGELTVTTVVATAERMVLGHLALLWDHGWQPLELLRHAHVSGRSGTVARLVQQAVAVDCTRLLRLELDPRWRDQAESVRLPPREAEPGWMLRWAAVDGHETRAAYPLVAEAMRLLFDLPPVDELIPPPGRPASHHRPRSTTSDPVLQRVRALLAKAESTEFEAEATALTAKAQEMITRHAIDAALLEGDSDQTDRPTLIRIPIDAPYADAKSFLLQTVADASRCRAVFVPRLSHSNVVGLPADLVAVEVLFTSLLVQAQHALTEAGRRAGPGARPRSQSFRSAFLLAYTQRIGERLDEINQHVFGAAEEDSARFLPVLRSQRDAVEEFMSERFGELQTGGVRGGYDSAGWASGRMAADQARLSSGDLDPAGGAALFDPVRSAR
jgi:hypothetical protein